jgi:hypothetical protein
VAEGLVTKLVTRLQQQHHQQQQQQQLEVEQLERTAAICNLMFRLIGSITPQQHTAELATAAAAVTELAVTVLCCWPGAAQLGSSNSSSSSAGSSSRFSSKVWNLYAEQLWPSVCELLEGLIMPGHPNAQQPTAAPKQQLQCTAQCPTTPPPPPQQQQPVADVSSALRDCAVSANKCAVCLAAVMLPLLARQLRSAAFSSSSSSSSRQLRLVTDQHVSIPAYHEQLLTALQLPDGLLPPLQHSNQRPSSDDALQVQLQQMACALFKSLLAMRQASFQAFEGTSSSSSSHKSSHAATVVAQAHHASGEVTPGLSSGLLWPLLPTCVEIALLAQQDAAVFYSCLTFNEPCCRVLRETAACSSSKDEAVQCIVAPLLQLLGPALVSRYRAAAAAAAAAKQAVLSREQQVAELDELLAQQHHTQYRLALSRFTKALESIVLLGKSEQSRQSASRPR